MKVHHLCQLTWDKQRGIKDDGNISLRCHKHHPHFHSRDQVPTMLLATSLAQAVAENIAMHGPAPNKEFGHEVNQYLEVSGDLGEEDKGRNSPTLMGDTAAFLHVDMD
jgi:hypothetical protein